MAKHILRAVLPEGHRLTTSTLRTVLPDGSNRLLVIDVAVVAFAISGCVAVEVAAASTVFAVF